MKDLYVYLMRKAFQCLGWAVGWFWWAHFCLFGSIVSCSHVVDNFLFGYKSFPFRPPKTRRLNFQLKWYKMFFFSGFHVSFRGCNSIFFYPFTLLVVFSIRRLKKKRWSTNWMARFSSPVRMLEIWPPSAMRTMMASSVMMRWKVLQPTIAFWTARLWLQIWW